MNWTILGLIDDLEDFVSYQVVLHKKKHANKKPLSPIVSMAFAFQVSNSMLIMFFFQ